MIIIDYSQVCIANYMKAIGKYTNIPVEIDLLRHMILNSIRAVNSKFRTQYGELVIAVDSPNSWRRDFFPYYKANRSQVRKTSDVDWAELYACLKKIKDELIEYFPYTVIQIEKTEADDIIGVLARHCIEQQEACLIVSGDKDFIQLQADNIFIKQWDTKNERWMTDANPKRFMFEHVMRGDLADGIPNVYSPDDQFITKAARQKKITTKLLDTLWEQGLESADLPYLKRNITLIDLRRTPKELQEQIIAAYHSSPKKNKSQVLNYFIKNNLKQLTPSLGDF